MTSALVIAIRVDASLAMGSGHVMRCLTLAQALAAEGAQCHFICREQAGDLIRQIRGKGFPVHALAAAACAATGHERDAGEAPLAHAAWLRGTQKGDAAECADVLRAIGPDWLVVDHYGLDARWESALRSHARKLMVIDDLADRRHDCDLLLDQNFGREAGDYAPLVPRACTLLCGARYLLLRPEFHALRERSLQRRHHAQCAHVLVSMGGVDPDNITGRVLETLAQARLGAACRISVVMGPTAPWVAEVRATAAGMPWPTEVLVDVQAMAPLMADSDVAIGAAGATSWERCCMGVPSILVVLADNQRVVANGLAAVGAAHVIDDVRDIRAQLPQLIHGLTDAPAARQAMGAAAAGISDGQGSAAVVRRLMAPAAAADGYLRPMAHDDLELVLSWRNHPQVRSYMYTRHEISLAEHSAWFERATRDPKRHLLLLDIGGRAQGFVNLHEIAPGGIADWGFYLAPDAPQGTGRKLGQSALAYAFADIGLHKVCGQALASNARSIRFHQRLGFSQEGVQRQQHFDGQSYHDIVCFGLLAAEWLA